MFILIASILLLTAAYKWQLGSAVKELNTQLEELIRKAGRK